MARAKVLVLSNNFEYAQGMSVRAQRPPPLSTLVTRRVPRLSLKPSPEVDRAERVVLVGRPRFDEDAFCLL